MSIQVDDILRVSAVVSMQAQEFVNVHHFRTDGNATANDTAFMEQLQLILAAVYANVQNWQADLLRYERLEGQNITQDLLLPTVNWVGNPTGNRIEDPLPTQVTANVFWPTQRPKTRCTSYLPGLSEFSNTAAGEWTTGTKDDLQLYGDELLGSLLGGGVEVVKGAYNLAADRFVELLSAQVPVHSRTQRRRRIGVGI